MTKNDLATLREALTEAEDVLRDETYTVEADKCKEALAVLDRLEAQESREAEPVAYVGFTKDGDIAYSQKEPAGDLTPLYTSKQALSVPTSADEAELMEKLGFSWLAEHAPERLTEAGKARAATEQAP